IASRRGQLTGDREPAPGICTAERPLALVERSPFLSVCVSQPRSPCERSPLASGAREHRLTLGDERGDALARILRARLVRDRLRFELHLSLERFAEAVMQQAPRSAERPCCTARELACDSLRFGKQFAVGNHFGDDSPILRLARCQYPVSE